LVMFPNRRISTCTLDTRAVSRGMEIEVGKVSVSFKTDISST
jgi:hypothetical protein